MAKTSAEYMTEYETAANLLPELAKLGDENNLKKRIMEADDYTKYITDAQAKNLEANRQIINQYSTSLDNPETKQLDVARQMRLKDYDTSANREQAQALGSYYNARRGTLADIIDAWRTSYDSRYKAAQTAADQLKEKWSMAFQTEQEQARRAEAAAALAAQYAKDNQDGGMTLGDAVANAGYAMIKNGMTREQAIAQISADYGQKYDDVAAQIYAKYPNGWEGSWLKTMGGAKTVGPIAPNYSKTIAQQYVGAAPAPYQQGAVSTGLSNFYKGATSPGSLGVKAGDFLRSIFR